MNTYNALVLNDFDYDNKKYATWVFEGRKTLETRFKRLGHTGDLIICCGGSSVTPNAGLAICMVHFGAVRPMEDTLEDIRSAMIDFDPKRLVYPLTDLRHFSKKFMFSKRKVSGSFQGIFQITIPDGIEIIKPVPTDPRELREFYRDDNIITECP